jgi:hypothetical protein
VFEDAPGLTNLRASGRRKPYEPKTEKKSRGEISHTLGESLLKRYGSTVCVLGQRCDANLVVSPD